MDVRILDNDLDSNTSRALSQASEVAWDTETTGLSWANDSLQVCQLFTPETGPVVVLLSERRPTKLVQVLEDRNIEKVFHHAPFDLRFMAHQWGARGRSIRCTKTASKILHQAWPSADHSLGSLVAHYLGVTLSKGAVRVSDWSSRPLDSAQVEYAAGDVRHLLDLAHRMEKELSASPLLDEMYRATCAYLPAEAFMSTHQYPNPLDY